MQNYLDYGVIVIYMLVTLGIGVYFSRKKQDTENYLLGGRNTPFIAIGLACMMSLLSSISIVMIPGEIYNHGLTLFILTPTIILPLGIPFYLLFTRFYFKLGSFTPYEYLEYRYDAKVRAIVAISSFYSRVMYIAMVLYSSAKIFESAYGWAPWFSILLVGVTGVLSTTIGGSKAVIWTDVFQFFVLFGGLAVVIWVLNRDISGGPLEAVSYAIRNGHGVPQFREADFYSMSPYVRLLFFLLLWNAIVGPLTSACSDQVTIQRLLSTRNWKEGLKSQVVAVVLGIGSTLVLWFIGLSLFTYYSQHSILLESGDAAFFNFVKTKLPPPMSGLFMAAMLAAIMSTVSSGINAMATVWLKEIHQKFINKFMDGVREVRVSRLATLFIGVFGMTLGICLDFSGKWLSQSVAEVGTIFNLLGAAILPAFLFAVLSSRANAKLIWGYTFFAFGEGLAVSTWYALSRSSEQAWLADPSRDWGWAGKLDFIYVAVPLAIGLALCLPYLWKSLRKRVLPVASSLLGLTALGWSLGIFYWYAFSNLLITDVPRAKSFAFYLPVPFLLAFVILRFCPKQPREKYQGLTLRTLGEPIVKTLSGKS